jgi:hypothetical protein
MTKRTSTSTPKELPRWRISRLKKTAKDADEAVQVAIKTFAISNPEHQKRLVARRVGYTLGG